MFFGLMDDGVTSWILFHVGIGTKKTQKKSKKWRQMTYRKWRQIPKNGANQVMGEKILLGKCQDFFSVALSVIDMKIQCVRKKLCFRRSCFVFELCYFTTRKIP